MTGLLWLLALVGAALLAWGVRGRLVDDHPLCRKCGYDLVGTVPAERGASSQSQRCPECAARLDRARAVRWGRRRRRAWPTRLGLLLFLTAALSIGTSGWVTAANFDLITIKPMWMLRGEAVDADRFRALPAQREIIRRLKAGALSEKDVSGLVKLALQRQPDLAVPMGLWGEIFDEARAAGHVSAEQLREFLVSSLQFRIVARPEVEIGGQLPFDLVTHWRGPAGTSTALPTFREAGYSVQIDFESLTLGSHELSPPERGRTAWGWGIGGSTPDWGLHFLSQILPGDYPVVACDPGPHVLRADLRVFWAPRRFSDRLSAAELATLDLPLEGRAEVQCEVLVKPRGATTIQTVTGDASREVFAEKVGAIAVVHRDGVRLGFHNRPGVRMGFPVDYAFRVSIRTDDGPVQISTLLARKNGDLRTPREPFPPELARWMRESGVAELTVVLLPSTEPARRTIDVDTIWVGEPIVITAEVRRPVALP